MILTYSRHLNPMRWTRKKVYPPTDYITRKIARVLYSNISRNNGNFHENARI